jgi:4-amino-4-deoxy-L-arabinose transferase-like glycosyltransferase
MASVVLERKLGRLPWEFAIPVAVALALGLWGLTTPGFWYDERVTSEVVQFGPFVYPWDAPIIPYYVIIWLWSLGGLLDSDAWLRGFSVLATLIAVGAIAWAARILGGRRMALAAGLVMALAPSAARYSQEARLYALGLALVSLAILGLVGASYEAQKRWWWLYTASVGVLAFVAPFALVAIPAFAVLVVLDSSMRRTWRQWLLWTLAIAPGLLAQGLAAFRFAGMHSWVPVPTVADFWQGLPWIASVSTDGDAYSDSLVFGLVIIVLGLLTGAGLRWLGAASVGVIALWVGSQGPSSFWLVRSTLPLLGFLALAAGFSFISRRSVNFALVFALLVALAWPSWQRTREEGGRAEDVKSAVRIVDEFSEPGDLINTKSRGWLEYGINRYSKDPGRYVFGESSEGRAWVFRGDAHDPQCSIEQVWEIPGGGILTLCSSLPEGWQADFQ